MSRWIRLGFFLLLAIAQLYITFDVITTKEEVLEKGTTYKFNIRPIDPNDPFRGKFVTLSFRDNNVKVDYADEWNEGEPIYVQVENDENGEARLVYGSKYAFDDQKDYFIANYKGKVNDTLVFIDIPFKRFYMEESKAPIAESIYRDRRFDANAEAYAVVKILHTEAVLEDVIINNQSILELVEESLNEVPPSDN